MLSTQCVLDARASMQENLSSVFANNKGSDQPAHPLSLISAFINHLEESYLDLLGAKFQLSS